MMAIILKSANRMTQDIAQRAKERRLHLNISQKTLSERSGVSFSTIRKFEQTGKISLESLLKIAISLNTLEDFELIFQSKPPEKFNSLDEILKDSNRKRGRG